ncbi:uncharacterized protein BX663DRAFT_509218 [Cokeromyces recurvatus]|uniref:uncharacterized protein n=1 Tax=Cokeromyces recurvatus TaxID=90255 RepID=UPI002220B753|nr:uncharacterized protein BX663DRAFT_509218 [Cokeromyces recurvatus]KAI7903010.1 hypothetical protein BX663DRAFT_509218 [Cokeromyces recurvatus]
MKIPGIPKEVLRTIFSKGSRLIQHVDSFTVKAIANNENVNRVIIVKSKKRLSKLAVIRARADRRIKSALQTIYPKLKLKGYDFIFFATPPVITTPWPLLLEQVTKSMKNIERNALFKGDYKKGNSLHTRHNLKDSSFGKKKKTKNV